MDGDNVGRSSGWSKQHEQTEGLENKRTDQHRHSHLPVLPSYRHVTNTTDAEV